jgi:hypothetical protein
LFLCTIELNPFSFVSLRAGTRVTSARGRVG